MFMYPLQIYYGTTHWTSAWFWSMNTIEQIFCFKTFSKNDVFSPSSPFKKRKTESNSYSHQGIFTSHLDQPPTVTKTRQRIQAHFQALGRLDPHRLGGKGAKTSENGTSKLDYCEYDYWWEYF